MSDAVTGRPARWVRNRLVDALVESGVGTLGWPAQGALMADLRAEAARQNRPDLLPMLAGQGVPPAEVEPVRRSCARSRPRPGPAQLDAASRAMPRS